MRSIRFLRPTTLVLNSIFVLSSTAVLVAPGSQCAVSCGNVLSSTSPDDITCTDSTYASSSAGQVFQSCVSCEVTSTYVDESTNQTDLEALLYNLRYSASSCLWGFPNDTDLAVTANPCVTGFACGWLQGPVEYDNLTINTDPYGYCSGWNEALVPRCEACLQQLGNQDYLTNYVIALDAACSQRPKAGSTLSISGSLFSSAEVVITTPTPSSASSSYSYTSNTKTTSKIVGIVVGTIVFCLIVAGVFVVCRGKRRRRAHLRKLARASFRGPGFSNRYEQTKDHNSPISINSAMFMAPHSYPWQTYSHQDESPVSSMGDPAHFSPYVSNYNSPVSSKVAKQQPQFFPTNEKSKDVVQERQVQGDEFEMTHLQEVDGERWPQGAGPADSRPNL